MVDKEERIDLQELRKMAAEMFGDMVKAVVDVKRDVMVVDAELHSDEEALLLQKGSDQADLWGINLYPELEGEDFIEYDSMINLRPSQENRSRGVNNPAVRVHIQKLISALVIR